MTMLLRIVHDIEGLHPAVRGEELGGKTGSGSYSFPVVQADNFLDVDRVIRPLCDQAHQMFGRDSSPYFTAEGVWNR